VTADSGYARAVVSLSRVQGLKEASTLEVVDLPTLAKSFVLEIQNSAPGTVVMVPPPAQER
jgi:hypothetical protein